MHKNETEYKASTITLPIHIMERIKEEAKRNHRSLSSEIAFRIEKSLDREKDALQ